MEKKNGNTSNLTQEQMENVAGGILPELGGILEPVPNQSMDSYMCPGPGCGRSLVRISGNLYRCVNPLCPKFGQDQYPKGQ